MWTRFYDITDGNNPYKYIYIEADTEEEAVEHFKRNFNYSIQGSGVPTEFNSYRLHNIQVRGEISDVWSFSSAAEMTAQIETFLSGGGKDNISIQSYGSNYVKIIRRIEVHGIDLSPGRLVQFDL